MLLTMEVKRLLTEEWR